MRSKKHTIAVEEDSLEEIRRYTKWALERAGTEQRLPTKVEDIVASAKLAVVEDVSLAEVHKSFFSRAYSIVTSALAKLRALVDLKENLIYLDLSMSEHQVNFATLHECGHKTLPWQRKAYRYEDDDHTLSSDVEIQFEREANQFAAEVLFQLDRFTKEAADLPLHIRTPLGLSKRYGASCHATIRRYVERHQNECAVLICRASRVVDQAALEIEHIVYSDPFLDRYGRLRLPRSVGPEHEFSRLIFEQKVRLFDSGEILLEDGNAETFHANFHIFNSTYRVFILIYPQPSLRKTLDKNHSFLTLPGAAQTGFACAVLTFPLALLPRTIEHPTSMRVLSERGESKDLSFNVKYLLDLEVPKRVPHLPQIFLPPNLHDPNDLDFP